MIKTMKHGVWVAMVLLMALPYNNAVADSVFWSIGREGLKGGYLLGTIHSEDPRVLDFDEAFLQQMARCDVYAMELVPDLPTMQQLLEHMRLGDDQNLRTLLGDDQFGPVAQALIAYGVSQTEAERMKPWAAMMTISQPPPETGLFMDFALSLRASGYGLEVTGLEELEQQLAFLDQLALSSQLELLQHAVESFDRVGEVHDKMVGLYLENSLQALEREAYIQMQDLNPQLQRYFTEQGIDARNLRMKDRAVELLNKSCTLLAVGALHLPGPSGLIQLLQDAGFELTPLGSPLVTGETSR